MHHKQENALIFLFSQTKRPIKCQSAPITVIVYVNIIYIYIYI